MSREGDGILRVHRGHAPNCSSAGSVVGVALVSAVAAAAVVNAWAGAFARWRDGGDGGAGGDGAGGDGDGEDGGGQTGGGGGAGLQAPGSGSRDGGGEGRELGAVQGGAGTVHLSPSPAPHPPEARSPKPEARPSPAPRLSTSTTPTPAVGLRREADGTGLLHLQTASSSAILHLSPGLAEEALAAGARLVGEAAPASVPGAFRAPTEVHLAVTDRCPVACTGCYLDAGPHRSHDPARSTIEQELASLAGLGVFEVAFGGGEGLLRDDILDLAAHARALGLTPNLTTSGFGLTRQRARRLAELFGQVNVSIDGEGATYQAARGWDGAARGLATVAMLVEEGCRVGVNTVLTRPLVDDPGALEALGEAIADLGAGEWQWLRFKPVGRGAAHYAALALDAESGRDLFPRALAVEAETDLVLRFDCALVPFLVAHEPPVALLERLGVRGCPGGQDLWARSADGRWAPCSFVAGQTLDDAEIDTLKEGWAVGQDVLAWRARAAAPPEPCGSCDWRQVCRGGCRAVAAHLVGDPMAPDPECPRVRAHAARETVQ